MIVKNFFIEFYAKFTELTGKTGTKTENRVPKLTETKNRGFPLTGTENRVSETGQNRKPGVPVNNRVCPTLVEMIKFRTMWLKINFFNHFKLNLINFY